MNDNALVEFVRHAIPDFIALYRFGSLTNGSVRPESDVDLAVLARHPLTDLNSPRNWPCNSIVMWISSIYALPPP
jgi:UTP:GlnB (protein PII) uridylyltransferase